ncbi:MAG: ribosomal L7Ae/L30e/S12e/Gadd45 family protein [Candidatus Cloacimonadota bacterium]|nr:ribosomal L7Ae/L30e/S12e/Gadd45 family protein [Candidatus Cloacimonadota bacterium]
MNNELKSLLQLAKKAGKLSYGYDAAERSCRNGDSALILMAKDLSARTQKGFSYNANAYNINFKEVGTKKDFGIILNRKEVGIISINDKNFAEGILKSLINSEE